MVEIIDKESSDTIDVSELTNTDLIVCTQNTVRADGTSGLIVKVLRQINNDWVFMCINKSTYFFDSFSQGDPKAVIKTVIERGRKVYQFASLKEFAGFLLKL